MAFKLDQLSKLAAEMQGKKNARAEKRKEFAAAYKTLKDIEFREEQADTARIERQITRENLEAEREATRAEREETRKYREKKDIEDKEWREQVYNDNEQKYLNQLARQTKTDKRIEDNKSETDLRIRYGEVSDDIDKIQGKIDKYAETGLGYRSIINSYNNNDVEASSDGKKIAEKGKNDLLAWSEKLTLRKGERDGLEELLIKLEAIDAFSDDLSGVFTQVDPNAGGKAKGNNPKRVDKTDIDAVFKGFVKGKEYDEDTMLVLENMKNQFASPTAIAELNKTFVAQDAEQLKVSTALEREVSSKYSEKLQEVRALEKELKGGVFKFDKYEEDRNFFEVKDTPLETATEAISNYKSGLADLTAHLDALENIKESGTEDLGKITTDLYNIGYEGGTDAYGYDAEDLQMSFENLEFAKKEGLYSGTDSEGKQILNNKFDGLIKKYSDDNKLDPNLVKLVMHKENEPAIADTVNSIGATGLMQIMPQGALADFNKYNKDGKEYTMEDMKDAEKNIEVGTFYLQRSKDNYAVNLRNKYPKELKGISDEEIALSVYNAGPGTVDTSLSEIGSLPAGVENTEYRAKILADYEKIPTTKETPVDFEKLSKNPVLLETLTTGKDARITKTLDKYNLAVKQENIELNRNPIAENIRMDALNLGTQLAGKNITDAEETQFKMAALTSDIAYMIGGPAAYADIMAETSLKDAERTSTKSIIAKVASMANSVNLNNPKEVEAFITSEQFFNNVIANAASAGLNVEDEDVVKELAQGIFSNRMNLIAQLREYSLSSESIQSIEALGRKTNDARNNYYKESGIDAIVSELDALAGRSEQDDMKTQMKKLIGKR